MKFDRLKASITNNANQEPSIYMTLCMIETLVEDVEDALGDDLSCCPVGSEALPSKLTWLCRTVNSIYEDNSDALQRNRARLDAAMQKLGTTRQELEALSALQAKLESCQAEQAKLDAQLAQAQDTAKQYEELCARREQSKQRLEALQHFDLAAAQKELEALQQQVISHENSQSQIHAQLEQVRQKEQAAQQASQGCKATLEELQQKQTESQQQLEMYEKQVQQKQSAAQALEQQLQESKNNWDTLTRQLEALSLQCNAHKQKENDLRAQADSFQKEHIDPILAEIGRLEAEQSTLQDRKADALQKAAELELALQKLTEEHNDCCAELSRLSQQIEQKEACARESEQKLQQCTERCRELESEIASLTAQYDEQTQSCEALRRQAQNFQTMEIEPIQAQIADVKQELALLNQSKEAAQQEYNELSCLRSDLIMEIARQKEACTQATESRKNSEEKLEKLKQEKAQLEQSRGLAVARLELLQNEVDQLQNGTLPELEKLIAQEQQRKIELTEQIASLKTRSTELADQAEVLKQQLPELEEKMKLNQSVYDSLTANYTAGTKKLQQLERQIEELRDKNDEQALATYYKQLENTRQELERIQVECAQIRQENEKLVEEVKAGQAERSRLEALKQTHESGRDSTARQLQELRFAATRDYAREVQKISDRLELLRHVRDRLADSISQVRRTLGGNAVQGVGLEEQTKNLLRDLQQRVEEMRRALTECADAVKLEER